MRFLFSTTRGTGHVQPLLPYARALKERGHDVLVAAPLDVGESLRQAGFAHAPFDHPGDESLTPIWARLATAGAQESMEIAIAEIFAGVNARAALPELQKAIQRFSPDLIVRDSVEFAALVAAEAARVKSARVAVHLVSFEESFSALAGDSVAALRAALGLAPDGGAAFHSEPIFSAFPDSLDGPLSGGANTVVRFRARMPDDEPNAAPSGAWRRERDGSEPLVYITFGTLAGSTPRVRHVYRLALDAVADLPIRAVLTTGPGVESSALGAIPSNVQVEAWIPQREVLPHAAAVVCHGGSGTVRGALAAGLPLVVLPFGADQPYNAQRIAAVGAGLALANADVVSLRAAVKRVLVDATLHTGAKRMAADIAALPSLESAVDALVERARAGA
jgi:UDP:flavonoid glycosyltransferase YjiC (YdhE family)